MFGGRRYGFGMALMAKGEKSYINIIHIPIHTIANYEQVRVVLGLYSPITYSSGRKWIGYIFESNKK